jgi:hypothetical protein
MLPDESEVAQHCVVILIVTKHAVTIAYNQGVKTSGDVNRNYEASHCELPPSSSKNKKNGVEISIKILVSVLSCMRKSSGSSTGL